MDSRERILARLKAAHVNNDVLPEAVLSADPDDLHKTLMNVLQSIGGTVVEVDNVKAVVAVLRDRFKETGRWISTIEEMDLPHTMTGEDPHLLENVQLSILPGHFAVAENGAVWTTSERMGDRALPFICEHLALVVNRGDIVATMRHAYMRIGNSAHDFGTFIAGPSKTADIEQSLVLGAHGPKTLTLFLIP